MKKLFILSVMCGAVLLFGCGGKSVKPVSEPPQKPKAAAPAKAIKPSPENRMTIDSDLPLFIREILLDHRKGAKRTVAPKTQVSPSKPAPKTNDGQRTTPTPSPPEPENIQNEEIIEEEEDNNPPVIIEIHGFGDEDDLEDLFDLEDLE